jgi:four helix bundle protein
MKAGGEHIPVRDLRTRTRQFALRILHLSEALPRSMAGRVMAWQVFRSGSSVGAHYRESCRSRSDAELVSKLEVALQELDETAYWLELIADSRMIRASRIEPLMRETNELTAILVTCVRKVKQRGKGRGKSEG